MKIQFHSPKNAWVILSLLSFLPLCTPATGDDATKNPRLITLGGAVTEIVFALDAGDLVVATDLSSTYPPEVKELPQVGYIRAIPAEGVLSMRPDLVIATDTLGPPPARKQLEQSGIALEIIPEPESWEQTEAAITKVGQALNREEAAQELINKISSQLDELSQNIAQQKTQPGVLFFLRPPGNGSGGTVAGSGNRADAMIRLAGGKNVMGSQPNYIPFSIEGIIAANPDIILLASMEGHGQADPDYLLKHPALAKVPAIRNNKVLVISLDDLNFGPRLGDIATRWADAFYK